MYVPHSRYAGHTEKKRQLGHYSRRQLRNYLKKPLLIAGREVGLEKSEYKNKMLDKRQTVGTHNGDNDRDFHVLDNIFGRAEEYENLGTIYIKNISKNGIKLKMK